MNYLKNIFLIAVVSSTLFSCQQENSQVTDAADYDNYLTLEENNTLALAEKEKVFWQEKLKAAPNQVTYLGPLAGAHSTIFEYTGKIENLKQTEAYLLEANERVNYTSPGYLQALSRNYISQHRFKEALALLKKAEKIGDKLPITEKMLFDVHLELGNDKEAEQYLYAMKSFNDFDYLIRLSKWEDHKGNLDKAIFHMENAKLKAEESKNEHLMLWSYTNLADFYGHAGRIEDSYEHYLKALEINPNYNYALKGIAWIVFSHEKNTEEANRIIDHLIAKNNAPDLYLFKADIAQYNNDFEGQKKYLNKYFSILNANAEAYGDMYNSYNVELYADNPNNINQAMTLAHKEVNNRATAKSYSLLAWANFQEGNEERALEIVQQHVEGQTFEPTVLYQMAEIYKANGLEDKVMPIKKELMASLFELGPNMKKTVEQL